MTDGTLPPLSLTLPSDQPFETRPHAHNSLFRGLFCPFPRPKKAPGALPVMKRACPLKCTPAKGLKASSTPPRGEGIVSPLLAGRKRESMSGNFCKIIVRTAPMGYMQENYLNFSQKLQEGWVTWVYLLLVVV